jgi:hypothetical protein
MHTRSVVALYSASYAVLPHRHGTDSGSTRYLHDDRNLQAARSIRAGGWLGGGVV